MNATADVIIVGAGAAGLGTGIFLGRERPGTHIVALDGARRIGAKILVSGGGRCNVTNARVTPADFHGGNANMLRRVLAAFPAAATRTFFHEIGVPLHEEDDGKLFPDSNSARTVVRALLDEAQRRGVTVCTQHRVTGVTPAEGGFAVSAQTPDGAATWHGRRVVLATGGLSMPKTGSDGVGHTFAQQLGHSLVPMTPALDGLRLEGDFHAGLSGVSHDAQLAVHASGWKPVRVTGPILWTHFGLSGPAALDVSRSWNRARIENCDARMTANFAAGAEFAVVEQVLLDAARDQPRIHVSTALRCWLPARVAEGMCARLGIPAGRQIGQLGREARRRLVHGLVEWPVPVAGTRGYKYAEVTAGGVPLTEVDPGTMGSRVCSGLYLVGEILDVDGRVGGFNFQWVWSSGFVAGRALARDLGPRAASGPKA